jgi:hypothetical protein
MNVLFITDFIEKINHSIVSHNCNISVNLLTCL